MRLFRARKIFGRPRFTSQASRQRGRRRRFGLEPLESRMMLHGDPVEGPHDHPPEYDLENFHIHAQLTISIDGEIVDIPANVGIGPTGFLSQAHTHEADNVLHFHNIPNVPPPEDFLTLEDFFNTWRTNAGLPGNNPDAVFSSTEILGHTVDAENPLRMFVNGVESTEFEDYEVRAGDNIALVYGSNPVLTFETNQGPILIELFPDVAPGTVDNFLDYVNDGDYANSIFHRLARSAGPNQTQIPFVLQGGGFTSDAEMFTDISQFEAVPTEDPIENEFELSNLRGTIAMAKLGGNPDSATSQWFVNLGDNSGNLDNQNGGFTVFGQVLGMWTGRHDVLPSTVDQIAGYTANVNGQFVELIEGFETVTRSGAFGELPLDDEGNVVRVESIEGEGVVRGTIFVDLNNNQTFDADEVGLEDVTVFADANQNGTLDDGEVSTTTDDDGNYLLRLAGGTHLIRQVVEDPFFQTSPANPAAHSVTVEIGREETDVDFANAVLGANDDTFEVDEDAADNVLDVLENDVVGGVGESLGIVDVGTPDQGGTVTIAEDGLSLIYTPAADFFGTETFTYEVSDGEMTEEATVIVQVANVNDPPTAVDDELEVNEDEPAELAVLENDLQDPDSGESLRVAAIIAPPEVGTAQIGENSQFIRYTPPQGFVGTVTLTYQISDRPNNGLTSQATVTINVLEANDPPTANPDTFTVAEDSDDVELDVLANDSIEPDEDETLMVISVDAASFSEGGSATISEDGLRILYTPAEDFFGTETFTYTIRDNRGGEADGTVTVTVTPVNDPPTAVDDTFAFTKDTGPHVVDVLDNDTIEPDVGETLTITDASVPAAAGTVEIVDEGSRIEYTPAEGFIGDAVITYTIDDGNGGTDEATATVTIRDFTPSSLAGFVYFDRDNDGLFDDTERPIGGVTISLEGTDDFGDDVDLTTTTAADGSYSFADLAPGTYTITQAQPSHVLDGTDSIGSQGGEVENDAFTIELEEGVTGTANNFGELGRNAELVTLADFFAIRTEPLVVAARATSGSAWYSASGDWSGFSSLEIEPSEDLSEVEVTARDSTDEEDSATAATNGSLVRVMQVSQNSGLVLVGLLVDSSTFGISLPDSESNTAMAVAADEMAEATATALAVDEDDEQEQDGSALMAALLAGDAEDDQDHQDALDAAFEEL